MTDRSDDAGTRRPRRDRHPGPHDGDDPGAFIGRGEPDADSIPGGIRPDDERIAAGDTQSTGVGSPERRGQLPRQPEGHRSGERASDARRREAGDRT